MRGEVRDIAFFALEPLVKVGGVALTMTGSRALKSARVDFLRH